MEGIKRESECCCCFSKEDLFSMLEPYNFEENVEIYSTMIADCFQIQLNSYIEDCDRNQYLICKNCVFRLRDAIMLRSQVQIAYERLQAERCTKREDQDQCDISSECSNLIDTKEHIIKNEIPECVNSGATLSNVNVLKLKPVKVVLEKIDNKTIENVSVMSACSGPDTKFPPSKIYFCNICNKLFTNLYAIQEHKLSHLNFKIFICDYCKKDFRSKAALKEHIMSHLGIKNFKCDLCPKYFVCRRTLSNHKRTHSVMSCNICGKMLSKRTFKLHVLSHSGVKNEKCEICQKTFARKDVLLNHKRTHFNKYIKTCKFCNKVFTNSSHLMLHEKTHLDIRDFICDYCKRGFRNRSNFIEHILLHMNIRNEKCDLCDKSYVSKATLLRHKKACHSVKLSCNICNKKLRSKRALDRHALLHSGVKNEKCDMCEKTFETKHELWSHKRIHNKRKYKKMCRYCDKTFTTNNRLLLHMKIHLNIRDLTCDYCKKDFRDRSTLREHILLHMDIKNVKCDLCDKCFVSKLTLSRHKREAHDIYQTLLNVHVRKPEHC